MSELTSRAPAGDRPHPARTNYINAERGLLSWLITLDHKRIGWLYLVSVTAFFGLGAIAAGLIRAELVTPRGDLLSAANYNRAFTMHGIVMVWLFLVPSTPAALGNFVLPLAIGARDLAFPWLNLVSYYLFLLSAILILGALILGGVDTAWTLYAPYSTLFSDGYVTIVVLGIFINGFSSIATGVNFIATIHTMRAPGLTWMRLPLFVWALYATSLIFVLATPVLSMAMVLLAAERLFGVGIFDPTVGGDPILFQHLFWFYSHPVVYVMILPAFGVITEVITCFARKPVFGYQAMVYAIVGIAGVGFLVWGHHMFTSGESLYVNLVFSFLSFIIAVPSAIKVFNWTATLFRGSITFHAPMYYAIGFIILFTIGGMSGLFLATLPIDFHVHDTYFVVAHFHTIMVGASMIAFFAGLHFWWPKMTGRLYSEGWAALSAILMTVGFLATFIPQFIMGYAGMPRRFHEYLPQYQVWHVLSSAGSVALGFAYLMPVIYFTFSIFYGRVAGPNPWGATGLEWQTPSPPPTENFDVQPVVTTRPYDYDPSQAGNRP